MCYLVTALSQVAPGHDLIEGVVASLILAIYLVIEAKRVFQRLFYGHRVVLIEKAPGSLLRDASHHVSCSVRIATVMPLLLLWLLL